MLRVIVENIDNKINVLWILIERVSVVSLFPFFNVSFYNWVCVSLFWRLKCGLWLQCDQIGWLIALLPTFQSLWQQLFCPNHPHFKAIFVKLSKSFMFLVQLFLCNFLDIWRLLSGPAACEETWRKVIRKKTLKRRFKIKLPFAYPMIEISLNTELFILRRWRVIAAQFVSVHHELFFKWTKPGLYLFVLFFSNDNYSTNFTLND